jgi:hypothetical protein
MDSTPETTAKPCFTARLCAETKRLVVLLVVLGLVAVAGKYYCYDRLNEEIRSRVETLLREHYRGLSVTVNSARRIAGQGVEIRGVRIAEGGDRSAPVIAEIDEIFAHCNTQLPDFLTGPLYITAIDIHRLKLRAERKPSGIWNLSHLLPLPPCQSVVPPVGNITDGTLEIVDPTQSGDGVTCSWSLRNIELKVQPQVAEQSNSCAAVLRIYGTLAGDHFDRVEIDGLLDPQTSGWEVRGAVEGLEFSQRLRSALPRELSEVVAPLASIRGRTKFGFHAARAVRRIALPRGEGAEPSESSEGRTLASTTALTPALSQGETETNAPLPIQFLVHGRISEGRIDDARLPEPLTDVEATIRCDNHGLLIDDLSARCGPTQLSLTATIAGFYAAAPIDVELSARQVQLDQLPTAALSPAVQSAWRLFLPRGLADVTGRLRFDGQQWHPDIRIDCHDLSATYARFPYRLTDGNGTLVVRPDAVSAGLRLFGGGRAIYCRAEVAHPGPQFTGWIELESDGPVPIDEKLLAAMDAPTQRIVGGFRPRGSASFFARYSRDHGEMPLRRQVRIQLHDCTIQHQRFAYPIDRVSGLIVQDDVNWFFQGLTGQNDSADITGEGSWTNGREGRQLQLHFAARDVPLAEELRQALPPSVQRLWSNLRPRGNLDELQVDLRFSDVTRQWSIDVGANKQSATISGESRALSLEPAWFRYSLHDLSGGFHYRDGRMAFSNLRAIHGKATVSAAGECSLLPGGGCRLDLTRLDADRVELDQDFLAALPAGLGSPLAGLPLEGPVNISGSVGILVPPQAEAPPQLAWELQLDVENGRLLTATPIEHIHGGITLGGRQSAEGLVARGRLQIDSAMFRGLQLTNIQGPYWLDGRRLLLGTLADGEAASGAPRQVTARTLGGLLSVDGEVALVGNRRFNVQVKLANADLAEITRQLAPHQQAPTGRVFALVRVNGNSQGRHTWRGNGQISLREADLYELPVMIRLLKLLSVQPPDTTAFTNSDIDFRIEGDDLAFDRIDFSGDAISLNGKGRMNGQQIDLKFNPLMGRAERHPAIFRPLLGQTAQQFMLIEVTGTLDQPQIEGRVFPRLDDQLAPLFPELARDAAVEPNVPNVWSPREALNNLRPFQRR